MDVEKVTVKLTVLTLNEEESEWLNIYMQNAFVENEDNITKAMRINFFNATVLKED